MRLLMPLAMFLLSLKSISVIEEVYNLLDCFTRKGCPQLELASCGPLWCCREGLHTSLKPEEALIYL